MNGRVDLRRLPTPDGVRVCAVDADGAHPLAVGGMAQVLAAGVGAARELVEQALALPPVASPPRAGVRALAPVDGMTEVWAAGVTYERSRDARAEESSQADVYDRVYDAERPELFLKALAHKVVGDGEPVGIRADSTLDVPEPELALVLSAAGETVGYTICNDMSSRSIEGENPLYLPQAKIYARSCALGPGVRPAWQLDPADLAIALRIERGGSVIFEDVTSTARLHRRLEDLVAHLFRADAFPHGAVLATGTGVVPPLDLGLRPGDVVTITVDGIGALTNPVVRVP